MRNGNDCPERDPVLWQVRSKDCDAEGEFYTERFDISDKPVTPRHHPSKYSLKRSVFTDEIMFQIAANRGGVDCMQIGKIFFFV